jgi:hypothetical protein
MKKLLLSLSVVALSTFAFAQKKAEDVVKFKSESIDMGKIPQGTPATATFTVTNIGKEPLIIETASPTCGCTIGNYTKEPIMPGKEGTITATYNAANLSAFEKHMNVKFAGVDEVKSITLKGEVLDADAYAKYKAAAPASVTPAAGTTTKTVTKQSGKKKTVKSKTKTNNSVAKVSGK